MSGLAPAKTYIGGSAWIQIAKMCFGQYSSVAMVHLLLWGLSLIRTGVLSTLGAAIIAIGIALLIISVVWNIPQIAAAIYYTIKDGGFKLKTHYWIVVLVYSGGFVLI
ncbi:hypothetical protein [Paracholeplasma manati]|uniref:Uncharacterized protein n=1 Tax=Paracholeplasma manati TaxID=591373 RepID=A0ABT2Y5A1_9MOLU|nr:hypothetical protein [Paracholeplasma manati]MCV2231925.1 hypothetical protein [Paracholeplasma manati]MDG0888922.1 hypothetical protein [Paracholeplasma manati]